MLEAFEASASRAAGLTAVSELRRVALWNANKKAALRGGPCLICLGSRSLLERARDFPHTRRNFFKKLQGLADHS